MLVNLLNINDYKANDKWHIMRQCSISLYIPYIIHNYYASIHFLIFYSIIYNLHKMLIFVM